MSFYLHFEKENLQIISQIKNDLLSFIPNPQATKPENLFEKVTLTNCFRNLRSNKSNKQPLPIVSPPQTKKNFLKTRNPTNSSKCSPVKTTFPECQLQCDRVNSTCKLENQLTTTLKDFPPLIEAKSFVIRESFPPQKKN